MEKPAEPGVSTVAERMGDPAYVKRLDAQRDRQKELLASRSEVLGELLKMSKDRGAAMKGADEAAVKAALEKDPAWQALQKRLEEMNAAIESNRQRTQQIVRERMLSPKKTISK